MKEKNNFYLAYATLMAGLFFIFAFIFAALLYKNAFVARDFDKEQLGLEEQKKKLEAQIKEFKESQSIVYDLAKNLENSAASDTNASQNELILLSRLEKNQNDKEKFKQDFAQIIDEFSLAKARQEELLLGLEAKMDVNLSLVESVDENVLFLSSESFFEKESFFLKNESKEQLKELLQGFFGFILENENVFSRLEAININIHTDDKGSSAYKLELSAKRANELAQFIYSFNKDKRLWQLLNISPKGAFNASEKERIELRLIFSNESLLQSLEKLINSL